MKKYNKIEAKSLRLSTTSILSSSSFNVVEGTATDASQVGARGNAGLDASVDYDIDLL